MNKILCLDVFKNILELNYKKILDRPRSLTLEETIEKMNEKDKSIYFKKLNKKIKYEEKKDKEL